MSKEVTIDGLEDEVKRLLSTYSTEATSEVKALVREAADACNEEIKSHISFKERTGSYVKNFMVDKVEDTWTGAAYVWHVGAPDYRLAHLLEKGHASRDGGRTKAFPHIKYGRAKAKRILTEGVQEAIDNAGKNTD